jgi:hypothetical protein
MWTGVSGTTLRPAHGHTTGLSGMGAVDYGQRLFHCREIPGALYFREACYLPFSGVPPVLPQPGNQGMPRARASGARGY